MPHFSIHWPLVNYSQRISEMKLSTEWDLVCFWTRSRFRKPLCLELRRISTSEEISVSGTFIVLDRNTELSRVIQLDQSYKFSTRMKPGTSGTVINLNDPIFSEIYHLRGEVNIEIAEKSATGLESEEYQSNRLKSLVELSNEFKGLLHPEFCCFSDVNLKCSNVTIPAHKNILSARSPVFAAMFKNQMLESYKSEVDINDIGLSTLRIMLTYIYSGETAILSVSSATELLFVADKYQLQDLKRVSCDYLKNNIYFDNVLKILVLGDMHCEDLKTSAVNYICSKATKFSDLEETEEWKALKKERPSLTIDVLSSVVKTREEKSWRYA